MSEGQQAKETRLEIHCRNLNYPKTLVSVYEGDAPLTCQRAEEHSGRGFQKQTTTIILDCLDHQVDGFDIE